MAADTLYVLTFAAAVLSGIMAGIFYAFSYYDHGLPGQDPGAKRDRRDAVDQRGGLQSRCSCWPSSVQRS